MVGGSDVGMPCDVPEEPEGRPEPSGFVISWEFDFSLNDASGETEFVPGLEHGGCEGLFEDFFLEGGIVDSYELSFLGLGLDDEVSILRVYVFGCVVVKSSVRVIVLIEGGPLRIRSIGKVSAVYVKLVTEN